MPYLELDAILRTYAAPALKAVGFKRKGREFALLEPQGGWGVIAFRPNYLPNDPGFTFSYGTVGRARMAWWEEVHGASWTTWPKHSQALLMAQAFTPDPLQHGGEPWSRPYRWALQKEGTNGEMGEHLEATLTNEVIPNLQSWFSPEYLAADLVEQRPGRFLLLHPVECAVAMALMDAGPSQALTEALHRIPEDNDVRRWMEARLASS